MHATVGLYFFFVLTVFFTWQALYYHFELVYYTNTLTPKSSFEMKVKR